MSIVMLPLKTRVIKYQVPPIRRTSAWCSAMLWKLKLKLARLHPTRARASYRPVGLALWDSWGELIPKSFLPTARGVLKRSPIQVLTTPILTGVRWNSYPSLWQGNGPIRHIETSGTRCNRKLNSRHWFAPAVQHIWRRRQMSFRKWRRH
jgi:hypothetical protein